MNHERLRCYHTLVDVAARIESMSKRWPSRSRYLRDQINRASSSAVLNLAEGNGKSSAKDRRRFFAIAQGSIAESAACLDLAAAFGLIVPLEQESLKVALRTAYAGIRRLP